MESHGTAEKLKTLASCFNLYNLTFLQRRHLLPTSLCCCGGGGFEYICLKIVQSVITCLSLCLSAAPSQGFVTELQREFNQTNFATVMAHPLLSEFHRRL